LFHGLFLSSSSLSYGESSFPDRAGDECDVLWKEPAKIYAEKEKKITFADVAGIDEAKEELKRWWSFLKPPRNFNVSAGRSKRSPPGGNARNG